MKEIKVVFIKLLSRLQHRPDWCVPFLKPFYGIYYSLFNFILSKTPETVVSTEYGLKLYIDYNNTMEREIAKGLFEEDTIECFRNSLKEGGVFIDVGANIGFFTILASRIVGESGRIYAFEPVPENYDRLLRNIELNERENIRTYPLGLSDKSETLTMSIPRGNPQEATIFSKCPSELRNNTEREKYNFSVKMIPFDQFYNENELSGVDVVKIDVEGAELKVLQGMRSTLKNNDCKIFMELNLPLLNYAKVPVKEFFDFFRGLEFYSCHVIDTGKMIDLKETGSDDIMELFDAEICYNLLISTQKNS